MERRKNTRFKKRLAITVDGKTAILNNISREGLQLSMNGLPSSRKVSIRIQNGEDVIDLEGLVLWVKKNSYLYQPNLVGISVTGPNEPYSHLLSLQKMLGS